MITGGYKIVAINIQNVTDPMKVWAVGVAPADKRRIYTNMAWGTKSQAMLFSYEEALNIIDKEKLLDREKYGLDIYPGAISPWKYEVLQQILI